MQLKSGCRFKLSPDILKEISANKHVLRDISYFRSLSGRIRLITVGDVTTRKLEEAGLKIFLEVVDLKTKRVEDGSFSHREGSIRIRNDPGTISHDLFLMIGKILSGSKEARIEVEGEEDLAAFRMRRTIINFLLYLVKCNPFAKEYVSMPGTNRYCHKKH